MTASTNSLPNVPKKHVWIKTVSSWENTVLACVDCNKRKADKSVAQFGVKLRKTPKKPSWKVLSQVSLKERRESWEKFLSRAYWESELQP